MSGLFGGIANVLGVGSGFGNAIGQNNQLGQYLSAFNRPPQIAQSQTADFISPEFAGLLEAERQAESEYNDIQTDPALRNAQLQALAEMQELADNGTSIQDVANQRKILNTANNEARANREAISQDMQSRGIYNSGLDYMTKLKAGQDSANRISDQSTQIASANADRRAGAIQNLGSMAQGVRGQEFGEQAQRASAQDQINAYNTQLVNQTNQLNNQNQQNYNNNVANTQNQETQYNINNTNSTNQANAGLIQGSQQMTNSSLTNLAGSNTNAMIGQGNAISNLGGSLISGGAMLGGAMLSDERTKKDVKKFDSSEFLDSLTGYKFKYKKPFEATSNKSKIGVMAQDLERVLPSSVNETKGLKTIDYNDPELMSAMLASLADINEKLKELK